MISIIICSRSIDVFCRVETNIKETIGVVFEIIRIDNSLNTYSITRAYNAGAEKAKYSTLCFIHEDVTFQTNNWGSNALSALEFHDLLGVAGSAYKSKAISGCASGDAKLDYGNIFHPKKNGQTSHYYKNSTGTEAAECVVLDGVWLCCKKVVWQSIRFDEAELQGFHFYDIDFSIRCSKKYRVAVIFNIDIFHNSQGSFDISWLSTAIVWHKKNNKTLPHFIGQKSIREINFLEKKIMNFWVTRLKNGKPGGNLSDRYLTAMLFKMPANTIKQALKLFLKPKAV